MGSYAQCWLDDLFIGSSKNDIDVDLISLFRRKDKIVRSAPFGELPPHLEHYRESLNEDPELRLVSYEAPVSVIRDRLDVLGYDLATATVAFREWVAEERSAALETTEELLTSSPKERGLLIDLYRKESEILSSLSPEVWIEGLKTIREFGLKTNYYGRYEGPYEDTAIGYMLSHEWYGYPGYDLFVPLRLAIEACESGRTMIYDLTDLIWSEYFDSEDDFIEYGVETVASEYSSKAKVIVLTEGKSDAWILDASLDFLYPHLKDYFSFLDFEATAFGGGVGNLANVVKAFAGSGIVNYVIALFDNDTAAVSARRGLARTTLPANIEILHLPEIKFLRKYPTIGPSGVAVMDVNGIAAALELYLGEDVLRTDGAELMPVQWTGYDRTLGKYQGEVIDKALVHKRFKEKITRARAGAECDWSALDDVLTMIFTAFQEKTRRAICKRAKEYYTR